VSDQQQQQVTPAVEDDAGSRHMYKASCLDLLPDDPSARHMHAMDLSVPTDARPHLNHAYALIGSAHFEEYTGMRFGDTNPVGGSPVKEDSKASQYGFYLVQFQKSDSIELNEMLQSDLFSAGEGKVPAVSTLKGGAAAIHSDQDLMLHVLAARKEGVLGGKVGSRPNSDLAILSTVCRWRSCVAEACKESGSKYLCRHHFNIKHFLDNASSSSGKSKDKSATKESAKFLPKKGSLVVANSEATDRDLQAIKGASTLIQELWDGKLKATVASFTHKTCVDMEVRRRLEIAMRYRAKFMVHAGAVRLQLRDRPEWCRWRSEGELDR
jgi:hypothetical protein